ncbi:MAG: hypothetical protein N2578_01190, partial [Bdellovibrionaceae bacterium]|nr:hypothetical protein [Pseudobdellovibrionaceae bacterium]
NIPVTAQRAIERLNPGDFVAFNADLHFIVGTNTSIFTSTFLSAKGYLGYAVSGSFLVHLFRMKDNRMRVKFIAQRERGASSGANVGVSYPFEVVGVR